MKTKSFTLIELLVVIVIIGILAGVIIVSTSSSINKANLAKAQSFSNTVQNELLLNLVSEWTFDEGGAEDTWGNNDGTVTGAIYQNKSTGNCVYGGCYLFDGDDYIDCGDKTMLSITGDLTLSAWIKITSDSNGYYVIGKGSGNDYNQMWWIGADGTKNPIFVLGKVGNTSATYIFSTDKLEVGKYYYILTTVSGEYRKLIC
ncbi:MAG: prepilin-type N-terminal cleavage/methylation domain-containing protein [Candidatus Pacebacteria bacterium]|nr:prepilin-type N-terminal cleavage/methylation domain-containing protein [Candidatus Paceibacterota bacterium]